MSNGSCWEGNKMIHHKTFMKIAKVVSSESYCKKSQVGALIVKDNRIISIGYNGTPSSFYNKCEGEDGKTLPWVIHAEANAILFASKVGTSINNSSLYVTLSPCSECAKMIIQSGIKEVYYFEKYRCEKGLEMLNKFGIYIKQIKDIND